MWNNTKPGSCIKTFLAHSTGLRYISITNDDKLLISSGNDSILKIWEIKTGKYITTFFLKRLVNQIAISKDRKLIVSPDSRNKDFSLWSIESRKKIR